MPALPFITSSLVLLNACNNYKNNSSEQNVCQPGLGVCGASLSLLNAYNMMLAVQMLRPGPYRVIACIL